MRCARGTDVLTTGKPDTNDPQFASKGAGHAQGGQCMGTQDDQQIGIGSIRVRVIATPGHTPGWHVTWTWDACEASKCLKAVYRRQPDPGGLRQVPLHDQRRWRQWSWC